MNKDQGKQGSQEGQGAIAPPDGIRVRMTNKQIREVFPFIVYATGQARIGKPGMVLAQVGVGNWQVMYVPNEMAVKMYEGWGLPVPVAKVIE